MELRPALPAAWTIGPVRSECQHEQGFHRWRCELWSPLEQYPRDVVLAMTEVEMASYEFPRFAWVLDRRLAQQIRQAVYAAFWRADWSLEAVLALDRGELPDLCFDHEAQRRWWEATGRVPKAN